MGKLLGQGDIAKSVGGIVEHASGFGWEVFVLVLVILGIGGFAALHLYQIALPRRRREEERFERDTANAEEITKAVQQALSHMSVTLQKFSSGQEAIAKICQIILEKLQALIDQHSDPNATFSTRETNNMIRTMLQVQRMIIELLAGKDTITEGEALAMIRRVDDMLRGL